MSAEVLPVAPEGALANTAEFPVPATGMTHLLSSALTASANEGARIVVLHWLYRLIDARQQWQHAVLLGTPADSNETTLMPSDTPSSESATRALHRARVALRRLRATLREHRLTLDIDVGSAARRALQRFGTTTGAVRDRDVQREWLKTERERLPDEVRDQVDAVLRRLHTKTRKDHKVVSRAFRQFVDPFDKHIAKRVSRYRETYLVGQPSAPITFARHLADRMAHGAAQLRHDIGMVTDVHSEKSLHRVRIRLKRHRAMLAPFRDAHSDLRAWYALATSGQNILGAMRDATILANVARAREFDALADVLDAVALAHYEAFASVWCHDMHLVTATQAAAVAALRAIPSASALDAQLPREIERKFLLHGLPPEAAIAPSIRIEQGWLPGVTIRERLRRITEPNGQERCTRTIKLGRPGNRIEIEELTDDVVFARLWPLTSAARIRKRRHVVPMGDVTWEIDVFLDRDLVLAEVELLSEDQPIALPEWLVPFVVREVTHDPNYLNSVMAQQHVGVPNHETR